MQSNEIIFRVFSEAGNFNLKNYKIIGINRIEVPISSKYKELKERVTYFLFQL